MRLFAICASVVLAVPFVNAADWPQWRGPERTEISKETGLNTDWTAKKPALLWSYEKAGGGYSGPAVVANTLYLLGAEEEKEFAFALNTDTGKEKWRVELGKQYKNGYGGGPRCTPTVDGARMYVILGDGDLYCLDTGTGKQMWRKNLKRDFGGGMMSGWGYSESPLVDGEKLICTPGGGGGAITALNKMTGATIWRSKELHDSAAYSSVVVGDIGGVRQYVNLTGKGVAGVKASDGALLWYYERTGHRTAVVPTAIIHDNHVYVTAGYGCGCDLIKVAADSGGKFTAEKVYANKNMVNHHGGVVFLNGYIYGHSDSQGWICQDFKTGEIKWKDKGPGKGSLTCAAGHIFCLGESNGTLICAEATPTGWKSKGSITLPKETTITYPSGPKRKVWTHPVIANGKLYLREQDLLFCYDVTK